jgi:hypothetical protein
MRRPTRLVLLTAAWTLAGVAHASYGQMRLEGVSLFLVFLAVVLCGLLVDALLWGKLFRHAAVAAIGTVAGVALAALLGILLAAPVERAGLFKGLSDSWGPVVFVVTAAIFLPFIVAAPVAQYASMRRAQPWPRWLAALMAMQLGLLPGFIVLAGTNEYFWQRDFAAARLEGSQVAAGGLGDLLERVQRQPVRIWGTGWHYPWPHDGTARSSWKLGLALGLDAAAPIAASEPLGESDRAALLALMDRHFAGFAVPHIRSKLVWDALEPGGFAEQLMPRGLDDPGTAREEVLPALLERLERDGARLCPGGRMADADRAVLDALIVKTGTVWSVEAQAYEMQPEWRDYRGRLERTCAAPPTAGSDPPAAG